MKQLRGFKYRFYPTESQRLELTQTFGCARFVYNWALALRTNSYYQDNVSLAGDINCVGNPRTHALSYTDTSNALTKLKKDPEKPWLKQVSSVPLQQGLRHLNTAFQNFFKGSSNNRYKARLKVAKLHAKIADCRKDFLHKLSTKLVSESQAIYTETLAVKNMMANHKLAKAIADCGWSQLLRQLEYKAFWHDRKIGAIDRWFPSSKRCNSCGHILDKLPLNIREWACPSCNNLNLRDQNAALNILAIGRSFGGNLHARSNQEAVGQTVFACGSSSGGDLSKTDLVILG
jgi:IS605 OrfB family transposase